MPKLKFTGDQTLVYIAGVKTPIERGHLFDADEKQSEYLLSAYAHVFVAVPDDMKPAVVKAEAPVIPKATGKLSTYSKAKK